MKNLKQIFILGVIIILCETSYSQVGIGTTSPNAALDVTSSTDGLLIPRIALTNTTTATVITPIESELVYNTSTINDVTPGFYYWDSAKWVRLSTGSNTSWLTTGNSGIIDGTNYIGTDSSTNVDVAFRRNNISAGKIATNSTSFGVGALTVGSSTNSSAFGNNALLLNTGNDNVAIGNGSLATNTTGIQNTGVGNSTLTFNTGSANSAFGFESLRTNSSGNNNTGVGFESIRANTTGSNNTGIGFQALRNNLVGTNNAAIGFQALNNNTASFNTAVGTQASFSITSGASNTSMGYQAHQNATTGSQNVAIGERSLGRNNGSANTVIGWEAMFGATSTASNNTAIGWHSLFNNSGANNTAIGYNALQGNAGATENTAIGAGSLNDNSTGSRNTAIGRNAGFAATSNDGTFVGYNAGAYSTGTQNAALGAYALDASGASARNVAIGYNALTNTTASNNTAIGYTALNNVVTGSGNVAIGYQAGFSETTSNKLYISNSNTTATTSLIYGEFAPTRILRTNSTFQIGDPLGSGYVFPIARGTINQYLASDANGILSWTSPNGTNTLSAVRTNLASNQALTTSGWQLINFSNVVFDTNSEFASNRFTASKAGIYEINAGFHTDNQSNNQYYSIGVYVNGILYQQTTSNHFGVGPVSRNINCSVNLAINDYVEIYVENYQAAVNIDSYSGKTFFEVHQIR